MSTALHVLGLLVLLLFVVGAFVAGKESALSKAHKEHEEELKKARAELDAISGKAAEEISEIHERFRREKELSFRERLARLVDGDGARKTP